MAIDGRLLCDQSPEPDVATFDICVMDAAWPLGVRKQVTENVLAAISGVFTPERMDEIRKALS